jgi:hypothetical protein
VGVLMDTEAVNTHREVTRKTTSSTMDILT